MKKLLLVVALAVTGLMCAKNEGSHAQMKNEYLIKEFSLLNSNAIEESQYWYWFTICGNLVAFIYDEPNYGQAWNDAFDQYYFQCGPGKNDKFVYILA